MTICFGSAAGAGAGGAAAEADEAAAGCDGAAGAVNGSGPPAAAAWASPSDRDLAANGSAPFRDPGSVFTSRWVAADVGDAVGAEGAADELLLLNIFSVCGTSYASSTAKTTAST